MSSKALEDCIALAKEVRSDIRRLVYENERLRLQVAKLTQERDSANAELAVSRKWARAWKEKLRLVLPWRKWAAEALGRMDRAQRWAFRWKHIAKHYREAGKGI